jgi:hypothetical protein
MLSVGYLRNDHSKVSAELLLPLPLHNDCDQILRPFAWPAPGNPRSRAGQTARKYRSRAEAVRREPLLENLSRRGWPN